MIHFLSHFGYLYSEKKELEQLVLCKIIPYNFIYNIYCILYVNFCKFLAHDLLKMHDCS